jgi:hypothetical protein
MRGGCPSGPGSVGKWTALVSKSTSSTSLGTSIALQAKKDAGTPMMKLWKLRYKLY